MEFCVALLNQHTKSWISKCSSYFLSHVEENQQRIRLCKKIREKLFHYYVNNFTTFDFLLQYSAAPLHYFSDTSASKLFFFYDFYKVGQLFIRSH